MAELTEEQRDLRRSVEEFARDVLAPDALARAHSPGYPWDVARRFAEMGLLGITVAREKGGQGGTLLDAVIAIQAVAAACPRSANVVQAGNFGPVRTLAEYATDEQRERFLRPLLAGEQLLGLGMTEPEAGSALTDLRTTATPVEGGVLVNGTKVFSTHSVEATVFLVYARFGPGVGGIGSVLVERDAPGFRRGAPSTFMNGEQWCQLYFDDCFVPTGNVLLGPGGFVKQMTGFNAERIGNSARSIAVGRHAFETAREHALHRHQFGRPLCEFQGLQWSFADVAVQLDAAQLLLERAATELVDGLPHGYQTAAAKLAANRAGFAAADLAVQVMGGTGFSQESLVEYCFRRTRGWMIAGGSTEILRNRIAESVFGRRFSQRGTPG